MNFFVVMSALNIGLAGYMIISSAMKLREIEGRALEQIVTAPIFIAVALLVLHTVSLIGASSLGSTDITDAAWRIVDMVTLITMIRLIKVIKE
ncbi:MAG: hypothetical protein ACRCXB_26680 [Aeromonadaceae bacterium]